MSAWNFKLLHNITLATVVLLPTAFPQAALGGTFFDDFSAGLSPIYWSLFQTTAGLYSVDASHGNVQLAKTAAHNPGGLQQVAIVLDLSALANTNPGDFSTQVEFASAVVPGPGLDQVELHTYFQDGSYFFNVYDNYVGLNVHVWNGSLNGLTSVSGDSGTFRIDRLGSTLTGYYNGSPIFSEINSSPLVGVEFILQNNEGSDASTSVTFDNFSVTADSVAPPLSLSLLGAAQVQVTWSTNSVGYALESAINLPAAAWTGVTNVPAVIGDHYAVMIKASGSQQFFRLHKH